MYLLRLGLVCLLALIMSPALAEKRVALVVGNSAYETVGALKNPINDASDIAIALEGLGFSVLLGTDLSLDEMSEAADRFGDMAAGSDVALFYYAGHGFQVGGSNFLVPVDAAIARADDVATQTIAMQQILTAMDRAPGLKLVMLDACRDNPFGAAISTGSDSEGGLARVGTAADFMFVFATQPDNVAYDGTGRNSFFTEAMLNHIYTPGQVISELLINVRRDVLTATGGRQVPWNNSSLTRQFRFDTSPPTASEETLLWQVASNAQDPQLMNLYLERYPEGQHAPDVLAFLEVAQLSSPRNIAVPKVDDDAKAERLYALARRTRMRPLLEFYLKQYPEGAHVQDAKRLLSSIPRAEDASPGNLCERLATHPRDATASNAGVSFAALQNNAVNAIQVCSAAATQAPELPHYLALLARATAAGGDLPRAISLYQSAAERGDLRAMVSLAQVYENGMSVPQDAAKALAFYEQAAAGGSHDAQINLAVSLLEGAGVPKDEERGIGLLKQASESGSAKATFNLGVLAQAGQIDTPEDALGYFERAARGGEVGAYRAAAILLDEGRGVAANPGEAANMLLRGAAEDGGEIVTMLTTQANEWSLDTLTEVQTRLKEAGFYGTVIDGLPGPSFTKALEAWRNGGFDATVLMN